MHYAVWKFVLIDILKTGLIHNDNNNNDNKSNNQIQRCNSRFLTISSLRRKLLPTHTLNLHFIIIIIIIIVIVIVIVIIKFKGAI